MDNSRLKSTDAAADDDEFEEFEGDLGPPARARPDMWLTNWDDEDLSDPISQQLRAEQASAPPPTTPPPATPGRQAPQPAAK